MDIVTHAGIGIIAAAPFLDTRPELALGLLAGSVLPDLDSLSRMFGKRAFLRSHQTWSHALLVQAVVSAATGGLAAAGGWTGVELALGLFLGLLGHSLLDWGNTLGVTLLAPFSHRRFRLEWVFFIDAIVMAGTAIAAVASVRALLGKGHAPGWYAAAFLLFMVVYFSLKGVLRWRAGRLAPGALSLMPSALWPWRFYGLASDTTSVWLFHLNAITSEEKTVAHHPILDAEYAGTVCLLPEFRLMRELSPGYHVVSAVEQEAGERVTCRDLRTRNFGTTFGDLVVSLDADGKILRRHFHV